MNKHDAFFEKIQNIHEDEFSKTTIIPLLKKIGYEFVDFNGGPYELGKDIIAYKKNEFDEIEVTVIQSKMFKTSRTSKSSQLFGQIIHQLSLCLSKKIPCSDGIARTPTKVIFITPFTIDTRHLSEQFENIQIKGVSIFDQVKLTALLDKYWPEVFDSQEERFNKTLDIDIEDVTNIELYRALHIESKTLYSNYYSDLNFFVGNTESRDLFSSTLTITSDGSNEFDEAEWQQIKTINNLLYSLTKFGMIALEYEVIESAYEAKLTEHMSNENQLIISTLNSALVSLAQIETSAIETTTTFKNQLQAAITTATSKNDYDLKTKLQQTLLLLTDLEHSNFSIDNLKEIYSSIKTLKSKTEHEKRYAESLKNVGDLVKEARAYRSKILRLGSLLIPKPKYKADLDLDKATKELNRSIAIISAKIQNLNNKKLTNAEARTILNDTNKVLRTVDDLTKISKNGTLKITLEKDKLSSNILNISAHTIFDSGCNVAIYGEAGAGKSTTLYVYAEKLFQNKKSNETVFFIPLNRVTSKLAKLSPEEKVNIINERDFFASLINSFLLYKDIPPTAENRISLINYLSKQSKVTVIIDALDEAANNADWIIPALSEIPKNITSAQVITSSRNCVEFIKNIEFLGITLLPFNKEQLKTFIFGWLNDQSHKEELWLAIQEKDLFEVAKNPLLATIICTLHENGIPVPENEPDVYRRKIELLCGLYDQSKGIKRAKNEKSFLERCCQKISFQMHARMQREASLSELRTYLSRGLESRVSLTIVDTALDDLINVCNILIKSSEGENYSFGHLRIQESLAAEELERNRSIDIIELMPQIWWRGVLFLYSFKNNIQPLFDQIYDRHSNFTKHAEALNLMIDSQPKDLQKSLRSTLSRHLNRDIKDGYAAHGFSGYDYDDDFEDPLDQDLINIIGF